MQATVPVFMHRLTFFRIYVVLAFVFSLNASMSNAQVILTGKVVDYETGELLPGASVQLEGTYTGTITNSEGQFSLPIPHYPATLIVRFIGYQSESHRVASADDLPMTVRMALSTIRLPELTITGEDPAIGIMRQVIENKKVWRATMKTYAVSAYNRFRMENDSGIVSIWESETKAYWDVNRGVREISLWQEQTQNMNVDDLLPAAMFVMNLYDDDVDVAGHTLMGVTHPKALSFYDFELKEIKSRDESEVYVIGVVPKSKTSAGFIGTISILDQDYAMISAELTPGSAFLFPPPVQYLNVRYEQQFSNFGTAVWLPLDFKADMEIKVGINRVLVFPEFKIHQLSSLSDFELNVTVPDSLYEQSQGVVRDSNAVKVEVLPAERMGVPLTEAEVKAYSTIDSTMTLEKAFKPTGIFARFVNTEGDGNNSSVTVSGNAGGRTGSFPFQVRPAAWYNRVEGVHLRMNGRIDPTKFLRVTSMLGYSFAQKGVGFGAGVELGKKHTLKIGFTDEIAPQYNSPLRSRLFNSVPVVMGEMDYYDFYRRRGWGVSVTRRSPWSRRIRGTFALGTEHHTSLNQKQFNAPFGWKLEKRTNEAIQSGQLQFVQLHIRGTHDSVPFPIGPQKEWSISIERGLGGSMLKGGAYTRYEGVLLWRFPTFFKRRLLANALDVRVVAGTIRGRSLPLQRFGHIDGLTSFTTFGGLKTLSTLPYRGTSWTVLAWEHTFRTVPFELIGWNWAVNHHWHVLLHGAHGKTWNDSSVTTIAVPHVFHQEAGVSLSGLFTILRLDATWRLDKPGFNVGVALARIF